MWGRLGQSEIVTRPYWRHGGEESSVCAVHEGIVREAKADTVLVHTDNRHCGEIL